MPMVERGGKKVQVRTINPMYLGVKVDPYGYAVRHIMTAIDKALAQEAISQGEYNILKELRDRLVTLDPEAEHVRRNER